MEISSLQLEWQAQVSDERETMVSSASPRKCQTFLVQAAVSWTDAFIPNAATLQAVLSTSMVGSDTEHTATGRNIRGKPSW